MIEITLLGGVSASVAGRTVTGEAAQRRRLALLTLLCSSGLRPVGRDRLMGHLWPENDADSARHLLSASLHVLRKALGADALLTTGDQIALNPALVHVDAIEFEETARRGEHEKAADLYTGPFADGLFISGAAEFEHWLDGRRTELARLFATALERSAEARTARGDLDGAVAAWRRLATVDPFSARTTLGLMRALVAAGNRAGALQSARVHEQLLEAEFGATPDPEVLRLAQELRQDSAPDRPRPVPATVDAAPTIAAPADNDIGAEAMVEPVAADVHQEPVPQMGPAPQLRPVRRRRLWLAAAASAILLIAAVVTFGPLERRPRVIGVVPLPDRGTGGDVYVGEGIAEEIHGQLRRARQLQLVNSPSSFLFRDSTADARRIGRNLGADALVYVRVRMHGQRHLVNVELVRTRDGVLIWGTDNLEMRGSISAYARTVSDSIARRLRVQLAAASHARQPDADAEDMYYQARTQWRTRTPDGLRRALQLFQRAIERDPQYEEAFVGLADTYNLLGSFEYGVLPPDSAYPLARTAAERALEIAGDFAPALATLGNIKMNYDRDWSGAERSFKQAIRIDSTYPDTREWLATLLIARRRFAEADTLLQQAQQYNRSSPLMFTDVAQYHYFAGDIERAFANIARALELDPNFSRAHALRALVLAQSGRSTEAVQALEPLSPFRESDPLLAGLLGYAYGRNGRRADALAQAAWLEATARTRYVPPEYRAMIYVGLDEYDRAMDLLENALAMNSSSMLYLQVEPLLHPLRQNQRFKRMIATVHPN